MKQFVQWSLFLVPWLSLFFIDRQSLRRFMPVALFATVVNTLVYQAAYHYNWWREPGLFSWDSVANIQWVYSAYLVATIWIFKYTYGKFWRYMLVNLILDGVYIFLWYPIQRKLGLAFGDLSAIATYLMMLGVAILIYVYQMWQEGEILGNK